jgi:NDP-sugar pyrophosphorylase family protein
MILAAGRGTRLAALGLAVPKPLVDLGGEPLLARQLRYLHREGVRRVVVNAYHLSDAIESFARKYKSPPEVSIVVERELLGTAGGVRNAASRLGDGAVIILYGDVLIDSPLAPMLQTHRRLRPDATIAVYQTSDVQGKGTVSVGDRGEVTEFREKAGVTGSGQALVNAGLYVAEPSLIWRIRPGIPSDFGHDVFPRELAEGRRLAAHVLPEPVIDVGTAEGLARARAYLRCRAPPRKRHEPQL